VRCELGKGHRNTDYTLQLLAMNWQQVSLGLGSCMGRGSAMTCCGGRSHQISGKNDTSTPMCPSTLSIIRGKQLDVRQSRGGWHDRIGYGAQMRRHAMPFLLQYQWMVSRPTRRNHTNTTLVNRHMSVTLERKPYSYSSASSHRWC